MNNYVVFLNMDTKFSSSYVNIKCNELIKINDTTVSADGIEIDFCNEIFDIGDITPR